MSRTELGEKAGVSPSLLVHLEDRGGIPLIDTVEKLAHALEISPCLLAYGVETSPRRRSSVLHSERIGQRLKHARESRGLSKKALGEGSSTTGQTVRNIEDNGMLPSVATAELLAKALLVSPCWLAFGIEEI